MQKRAQKNTKQHMHSPWIAQLKKRTTKTLHENKHTNIVIVGAGIAGTVTAYYLLKDTNNAVILLDSHRLGHAATGHNAGQIASYFEQPFAQLVKTYGLKKAARAQLDVLLAWDLLDRIIHHTNIKHQPTSFAGYLGLTTIEQIIRHLKDCKLQLKANIQAEFLYILDDPDIIKKIPEQYASLYTRVTKDHLQRNLETTSDEFIAAVTGRKGTMNSALFCEELVSWMKKEYKQRFSLYEHTKATRVTINAHHARTTTPHATITSDEVILCTNGFEHVPITYKKKSFKVATINGTVGFMIAGSQEKGLPSAVSYFPKNATDTYFYSTRRNEKRNALTCTGGPDTKLKGVYDKNKLYNIGAEKKILEFLENTHFKTTTIKYRWEGLMGYTKTNMRCIGKNPHVPKLWYNLGCNGVGILPSIHGGKRISLLMQGVKLEKSLFDPEHSLE